MLTPDQREALPGLAAEVARRWPGTRLDVVHGRVVLTVGPSTSEAQQDAAVALVAGTFEDFRLITPDEPAPAPATEEWLAEHRRGSHHLDNALTSFR